MLFKWSYICLLFAIFVNLCKSQNTTGSDDNDVDNPSSKDSKDEPSCSKSSINVKKKKFVYIWKIENFMESLEIYDTAALLEIQIVDVVFNNDPIKGKWSFKLTNTKKYGYIAVYANHTYDDPKTIPQKLIRTSLKYSSQEYRGSPFYSSSLKGIEQPVNQISSSNNETCGNSISSGLCCCPQVSSSLSNSKKRNNNKQDYDEDMKYPIDYYTTRQQIPFISFEFPIFDIFSVDSTRSSKITEAENLKLKFEIDMLYPEIVKEVSKTCVGV